MAGYGDTPDIWEQTKTTVKNELAKEARECPDAAVTILPFQDKVYPAIKVDLKNYNWEDINSTLDGYVQNVTFTNICDAWLAAEKLIDPTCENYIMLMTDGTDNHGGMANILSRRARLVEILSDFCRKEYPNTHGFYIELTAAAAAPDAVRRAIEECPNLYIIDGRKGIPSFGCFTDTELSVNSNNIHDITLDFSDAGTYNSRLEGTDNDFVDIVLKDGKISGGTAKLILKSKYDDVRDLHEALSYKDGFISFNLVSDEINIVNGEGFELTIINKPIRSLELKGLDKNGVITSSFERIHPFLWVKGNETDTLSWDLDPVFSDQAVTEKAKATYAVQGPDGLLFNGNNIKNGTVTIEAGKPAVFTLPVSADTEDAEPTFRLVTQKWSDLDLINDAQPDASTIILGGSYETYRSWTEIIVWSLLALIVASVLIWFCFIRPNKYPKFKGCTITISSPYFATIRTKGLRKIVFTPTAKKQGVLNRLFTGRVEYHVNTAWPCEAELTPASKGRIRFGCPTHRLVSDPMPVWQRQESYKIVDTESSATPAIEVTLD